MTQASVQVETPLRGGLLGWFFEGTPAARRGLLAASLGWMLDAFDVMLYSMVLASLLVEFGITKATAGLLGSLTLVASAVGGVLFGMIADRKGRRIAMIGSVLTYSVFTAACGLAQSITQLALFRFLLGLGMGGEWTSGAALVSETWPDKHRGKALGLMQSAWAIGYAAAAVVSAIVLPRYGWRVTFFIGILPALFTIWVRRRVEEPAIWKESRESRKGPAGSLTTIFRRPLRPLTIALTSLSLFTLFAYWGLNLWVPAYLSLPVAQRGIGLTTVEMTQLVVTMQVGTWLGYVSFGFISDAFGRKRTFVVYLLAAAVLVALYGSTTNITALLILGPFVTFFGTGYFSGFGAVTAEIYPTAVRATAQGFTFNVGRVGSALAPFLVGSIAESEGFGFAFLITSGAFLLGALTWLWIPETRGRALT
jgi:MFS family permease